MDVTGSAVTVDQVEDAIVEIGLHRPPVNALSTEAYQQIRDTFRTVSARTDIKVVILRSHLERVFCAGADLDELTAIAEGRAGLSDVTRQGIARQMLDAITDTPQVTIAAVNGPAIGAGAALISCCDIRIGSPRATICLPEINVGRCGGARHWIRLLPQGVLREMYFTGQPLSADDALRFGAISRIVPGEELRAATVALARTIAGKGPVALRLAKQALNGCEELPLSAGYAYEQMFTLRLGETDEARQTLQAAMAARRR
jgi:enoyl-CoA hydratase/carnithine racemase